MFENCPRSISKSCRGQGTLNPATANIAWTQLEGNQTCRLLGGLDGRIKASRAAQVLIWWTVEGSKILSALEYVLVDMRWYEVPAPKPQPWDAEADSIRLWDPFPVPPMFPHVPHVQVIDSEERELLRERLQSLGLQLLNMLRAAFEERCPGF